jgi:hypothetical protein
MHNALPCPRRRATGTACEAGDAKPIPHNQLLWGFMRNGSVEVLVRRLHFHKPEGAC